MKKPQAYPPERFALNSERLGPLPLVNHFLERMGLPALLEKFVPTADRRRAVSHAQALGVLLRSILVEREPVYRQQETVHGFAPGCFGIDAAQMARLTDDRIGRSLDRLFDADRAALLTAVVVAVGQRFGVTFERLHNDSTSIAFCGQYRAATGRELRGCTAPAIAFGFSKDHRPDLRQLLFILTVTAEGVPASFRCADGNTSDSVTHVQTWEALRAVAGRRLPATSPIPTPAVLLRGHASHRCRGRAFRYRDATRSRQEDARFRQWIQTHDPAWEQVWIGRILGTVTDHGTAGTSTANRCPRWRSGRSPGVARCSGAAPACPTRPPARRGQRSARTVAPAPDRNPRAGLRVLPRSISAWPRSSSSTGSPATSRSNAWCASAAQPSRSAVVVPGLTPRTARSPAGASTSNGRSTPPPWPTTRRAMACIRCSATTGPPSPRPCSSPTGPAHHREAFRAGEDRARDRPDLPQERRAHRGPCSRCTSWPCSCGAHRA
ncbi:MAG: DUF4277 domain-containing protein [Burkholderiales bacterium]|nr:DUF4277 domain-containing protein [Burkholderiales bacterium]